jgi:hypothetical protein
MQILEVFEQFLLSIVAMGLFGMLMRWTMQMGVYGTAVEMRVEGRTCRPR